MSTGSKIQKELDEKIKELESRLGRLQNEADWLRIEIASCYHQKYIARSNEFLKALGLRVGDVIVLNAPLMIAPTWDDVLPKNAHVKVVGATPETETVHIRHQEHTYTISMQMAWRFLCEREGL